MSRSSVRVGLVGWGLAGRTLHAPFIQTLAGFDLAAAVTSREIDPGHFPSVRRMATVDELLGDQTIDLVVIASPNAYHLEQTLAALRAGKHVVCDKPLAQSADEVRALTRVAKEAGRLLIPFQNRRYDGDFRTVQQLVGSGRLGRVHSFESRWSKYQGVPRVRAAWKAEPEFNGPLWDLCPHLIDQAVVLFGAPQHVFARIHRHRPHTAVVDFVRLSLFYASGLEAVLEVDQLDGFGGRYLALRGALASFEKRGFDPQEAALVAGAFPDADGWGREPAESWGTLRALEGEQLVESRIETLAGDHRLFYQGVLAAIRGGQPSPIELDDVVVQLQVIEAALRSQVSAQVEPLRLPSPP